MVWDYIIIGSGFGGSVSALRLTEKGYKVLVLEKGRRSCPAEEWPRNMARVLCRDCSISSDWS